jgi:hypothetical protein
MDLTDIYRIFHLVAAEYIIFSETHEMFSKTDNILGHKGSLNKYRKNEIISSILRDHNEISRKYPNTWRLNNSLLNNQ